MRSFALTAAIALAALACQAQTTDRPSITGAGLAELIRAGRAPLVLDVRTADEYRSGHIPGAVNVPIDELPARLSELRLAKTEEVVVHCERGPRAAKAEAFLVESGYTNVVDLQGHMKGWRDSGLPVE